LRQGRKKLVSEGNVYNLVKKRYSLFELTASQKDSLKRNLSISLEKEIFSEAFSSNHVFSRCSNEMGKILVTYT